MAGLHEIIPGLQAAEERFQESQLEAFLGVEPDICGLEVKPFTPQMFVELMYAKNECMGYVRDPDPVHMEQFLWRISANFSRTDKLARHRHVYQVSQLDAVEAADHIMLYLHRAWEPMPQWVVRHGKKRKAPKKSSGVWPSFIVDSIAAQYGWSEECIMNTPFRRLWQYCNRILERHDDDYAQGCPEALRLKDAWLCEQNRRN